MVLPDEVEERMEGALLTAPLRAGTSRNFEDGTIVIEVKDKAKQSKVKSGRRYDN
jgi:hypothetical protein